MNICSFNIYSWLLYRVRILNVIILTKYIIILEASFTSKLKKLLKKKKKEMKSYMLNSHTNEYASLYTI